MMSPEYIRSLSDDAAREASQKRKKPYAIFDVAELRRLEAGTKPLPFPFLGSYTPPGYEKVEELFVDSSGFGSESEPAMTKRAFFKRLHADMAAGNAFSYALTEVGQFQCYVGVYRKKGATAR
jgi:hypothetical protein